MIKSVRRNVRESDLVSHPTPIADINVPRNAKVRIEPKFRKKFSWKAMSEHRNTSAGQCTCLSSYPEFRIMGGSSKLKNIVCLKVYIF
jgi:hypothetical protein